ncbi:MAG: hypothetical protein Q7R88_00070 [bacterium]|nr:hypothetical protein [bacterium]
MNDQSSTNTILIVIVIILVLIGGFVLWYRNYGMEELDEGARVNLNREQGGTSRSSSVN